MVWGSPFKRLKGTTSSLVPQEVGSVCWIVDLLERFGHSALGRGSLLSFYGSLIGPNLMGSDGI